MEQEVLVRYDIKIDEYVPVTQEWVTQIQNRISEYRRLINIQKDQIQMLEALLKV